MTTSMTAYASRTGADAGTSWMWELRGVNARGLDLRFRVPDGVAGLEPALRVLLRDALQRGSVMLSLRLNREDAAQPLALDEAQLDRVLQALDHVQERAFSMGVTLAQPNAADVLAQRGVILQESGDTADSSALLEILLADVKPLLDDFHAMRAVEGAALQTVISDQLDRISDLVDAAAATAEARKPEVQRALSENLARVMADVGDVDPARVAQELAMLAVKADITEELDRLRAHVAAARAMLDDNQPMGRKLDFLAQEFNREANTLCSKSQNVALTAIGLDLKAVIEQMREQIQNVE